MRRRFYFRAADGVCFFRSRDAIAHFRRFSVLWVTLALSGCAGPLLESPSPVPAPPPEAGVPATPPMQTGVDMTYYAANPAPGNCIATCVRAGQEPGFFGWLTSLGTPKICHSTCMGYDGRLVYLPPSTPGAGAIITSLLGPVGDIAGRLVPTIPIAP